MAVAVKTSPGARPGGNPTNPTLLSLVGVLYLVVCLALLFKFVPEMWWTVWNSIDLAGLQLARFPVVGGTLLVLFGLLLAGAMLGLASRVLGEKPPPGVKAGVFVGFVSLLVILLLSRWISIYIERLAYSGTFTAVTGAVLTGAVTGILLLVFLRLFSQKWAHNGLVKLENMGWFTFVPYKPTQGLRVRRGTIFGILLLVGAGIYTMMVHHTLRRIGPDWTLNIPFTGAIAIESFGDQKLAIVSLPPETMQNVEIRYPGAKTLRLQSHQILSLEAYRKLFARVLAEKYPAAAEAFADANQLEAPAYLEKVNQFIYSEIESALEAKTSTGEPLLRADTVRRLRALDNETYLMNLDPLLRALVRELSIAKKATDIDAEIPLANLPTAVLLVDRFAMREVDQKADVTKNVFLIAANDATKLRDSEGKLVPKSDVDDEISRIKSNDLAETPPETRPAQAAYGPLVYSSITLLPSLQYTVPLLVILAGLWLSWRLVNVPTFADFLIATDGEMNKVSWSTQKKLVQDTIVVLVTMLLMAVFLFMVDFAWKNLLQPLGVLYIPPVAKDLQRQIEQKPW
ncbi:MAG: preprotein translocase subunit SecE [Gemmataceae bacterium]